MGLPAGADLILYQGDTYRALVTVAGTNGTPPDITGYDIRAQIRDDVADIATTIVVSFTVAILGPTDILLSLTPAQTTTLQGNYRWDLELDDGAGDVNTVLAGRVKVTQEVTR